MVQAITEIIPAVQGQPLRLERLLDDAEIRQVFDSVTDDGDSVRNAVTIAQDDFEFLRQMLLRSGSAETDAKTKSIQAVKAALYCYANMHWKAMADNWTQFLGILRKEEGDAAWEGKYAPVEISAEMWSYINTLVPKFYADLMVAPLIAPSGTEITIDRFLDGGFQQAKELTKFLSGSAPSLASNPAAQHWAIRAAETSTRELIQQMNDAGVRRQNQRTVPLIPALKSLESRHLDPETGEVISGATTVVVLYLDTPAQERLFELKMGGHCKVTLKTKPDRGKNARSVRDVRKKRR